MSTVCVTYTRPRYNSWKLHVVIAGDVPFVNQHVMHGLKVEAFFDLCIRYQLTVTEDHQQ